LVSQGGAWYTYTDFDPDTGEVIEDYKFQAKDFADMLEDNPKLRESMYQEICRETIMRYRSNELDYDNTEIETEDEG